MTAKKAPQIQIGTTLDVSEYHAMTGTIAVEILVQNKHKAFPVALAEDGITSGVYAYKTP